MMAISRARARARACVYICVRAYVNDQETYTHIYVSAQKIRTYLWYSNNTFTDLSVKIKWGRRAYKTRFACLDGNRLCKNNNSLTYLKWKWPVEHFITFSTSDLPNEALKSLKSKINDYSALSLFSRIKILFRSIFRQSYII